MNGGLQFPHQARKSETGRREGVEGLVRFSFPPLRHDSAMLSMPFLWVVGIWAV